MSTTIANTVNVCRACNMGRDLSKSSRRSEQSQLPRFLEGRLGDLEQKYGVATIPSCGSLSDGRNTLGIHHLTSAHMRCRNVCPALGTACQQRRYRLLRLVVGRLGAVRKNMIIASVLLPTGSFEFGPDGMGDYERRILCSGCMPLLRRVAPHFHWPFAFWRSRTKPMRSERASTDSRSGKQQ